MQLQRLGDSDLTITPVGIGAWAMGGGGWAFAWGPQDDQASIDAIRAAIDAGWNWIDTAPVYGLGHSEEVVAKALDGVSPKPYIFTKCARNWDEQGRIQKILKRDAIRKECENSLRRLKVEAIDLYQIHWPEPDEDVEEGWETLVRLKEEGKVRFIGVSNFTVAQLKRIAPIGVVTSVQPPYSLLRRGIEADLLPYCLENGTGVLVYSPMQSGLLAGRMTPERIASMPEDDHRKRRPEFNEPQLSRNLALVERLREMGAAHGRTPGEVAIAWALAHPAVTAAIVGLRSVEQLEGVRGAAEFRLSSEELIQIEQYLAS